MSPPFNPTCGALRSDKWGDGKFGASRGSRIHKGVDILGPVGGLVASPVDGMVIRTGLPYGDGGSWDRYLVIREQNLTEWRLFYITPLPGIVGTTVRRGQAIAILADVSAKYGTHATKGRMKSHLHLEKWANGQRIDPDIIL